MEEIEQEKINYLIQYASIIKCNMMQKLENGKNPLYLLRSILLSKKPLAQCDEFNLLNQFVTDSIVEIGEIVDIPDVDAQNVLAIMAIFENRSGEQAVASKILTYQKQIRARNKSQSIA